MQLDSCVGVFPNIYRSNSLYGFVRSTTRSLTKRLFGCDDLAFIGDQVIGRGHAVKGQRELPGLVTEIVQPLQALRVAQNQKLLTCHGPFALKIQTRPYRMSFTYVIPDIHGRADLLRDGLAKILDYAAGQAGTIVLLGDYVDKGPGSREVIDRLRMGPPKGWLMFPLRGNHDAMMVEALRNPSKMQGWLERGGDAVIRSYGGDASNVPPADIEWLDKLPLIHIDGHRIYVHAGLDPDVPLDRQAEKTLLWKRYPDGFKSGFGDRHVVHGHNSFLDGPKLYEGRTNLDTRAWRSGRLVVGVFDDTKPGGPVDFIQVQGPPA
jgi:serine/threonine protein phosphatase 1